MSRRFGYTLIEILVAAAMSLVVLGALVRVFMFGLQVNDEARSSYLIRADADVAFRQIQEELRGTHLGSIRIHRDGKGWGMASPLKGNDFKSFELTEYGVAKWKSWSHFVVIPNSVDGNTGDLVRWEEPYPAETNLPLPPKNLNSEPTDTKWSLLNGVVAHGIGPEKSPDGIYRSLGPSPTESGLQLRFVRRAERKTELSERNPSQDSDFGNPTWSQGTTKLVECKLQVADISKQDGRLNLYTLKLRVRPRN